MGQFDYRPEVYGLLEWFEAHPGGKWDDMPKQLKEIGWAFVNRDGLHDRTSTMLTIPGLSGFGRVVLREFRRKPEMESAEHLAKQSPLQPEGESQSSNTELARSPSNDQGPFGIILEKDEWKAKRGPALADFAGKEYPWIIFQRLCRSYPGSIPTNALVNAVWNRGEGSKEAMFAHMTAVRNIIKPLNLAVENIRKVGYRLVDLAAGPAAG
jgi:hypothetical protein